MSCIFSNLSFRHCPVPAKVIKKQITKMSAELKVKISSPSKLPIPLPIEFTVAHASSIRNLKQLIYDKFPPEPSPPSVERQRLIFRGRILEDATSIEHILKESGMLSASTINFHLVIKPEDDPAKASKSGFSFFPSLSTSRFASSSSASSQAPAQASTPPPEPITAPATAPATASATAPAPAPATPPATATSPETPVTPQPAEANTAHSTTTASDLHAFGFDASQLRRPENTPSIHSTFETTQTRTQTAGVCSLNAYKTNLPGQPAATINVLGGNTLTPVSANDIVIIKNYAGQLLCCLSPVAIAQLYPIIQKQGNPPLAIQPLYSNTPIFAKDITRPTFNLSVRPSSNLYIAVPGNQPGFPGVPLQPTPTQQPQAQHQHQPQPAAQQRNRAGDAGPRNGRRLVVVRMGGRQINVDMRLFRNAFLFMFFLFRVSLVLGDFPFTWQNGLGIIGAVVCVLIVLSHFDIADNIQDRFHDLRDQIHNWTQTAIHWLPYHHPPADPRNNNQPIPQQNQAPNRIALENVIGTVQEFGYKVQGFLLMFVGTLVPFLYERWQHEDLQRRNHAEALERERLRQEQEQARIQAEQAQPFGAGGRVLGGTAAGPSDHTEQAQETPIAPSEHVEKTDARVNTTAHDEPASSTATAASSSSVEKANTSSTTAAASSSSAEKASASFASSRSTMEKTSVLEADPTDSQAAGPSNPTHPDTHLT